MKPRLKYSDVFPSLDFEHMAQGTPLEMDGVRVEFDGHHYGSIWVRWKKNVYFIRQADLAGMKVRLFR